MRASKRSTRIAHHLFRLCLDEGRQLNEQRVRMVVAHILADKRRHGLHVLAAFERLVRLHSDRYTAVIESAVPLSEDMRDGVRADLVRVYGPKVEALFEVNPALIGGMRIKVGSEVYDDSVRARLNALEARL
jgi:F-type H+-transporting ATPase subunit delta